MNVNPLICSPSPRDLLAFKEGQNTIPCDKLLVKYHHARRAYKILRSYFLDHKEYTHLILHPDDLIVDVSHYNVLKKGIEQNDYPVFSGVCNVMNEGRLMHMLAVVISKLPTLRRNIGSYDFARAGEYDANHGIVRVKWVGFPFMWVRRDIMEKIEFDDDTQWNPQEPNMGWGFDAVFCHRCNNLRIPIYANFRVFMHHEKRNFKIEGYRIKTGTVPPKVLIVKNNEEQDITEESNNKYLTEEDWKQLPHLNSTTHRSDMI